MLKYRIPLKAVTNAAAGKTALIELPTGPRYHSIHLKYVDTTQTTAITLAAAMGTVKVRVNGRVQREARAISATDHELHQVYVSYGSAFGVNLATTKTAIMPIWFAEPWRKDARDQDGLAWSSAGWSSFQLEIGDMASTFSSLTAYAVVDDFVPEKPNPICKWIRQSFPAVGSAIDISTLNKRDYYQQLSL
jgi:hypothetical protein